MHRIGLGGVQNFDASLDTPQIVADRLAYMTPAWRAVFREAVQLADAQDMEFGIAASPGWSETGGPWVLPQDGMKKLVWSEWRVPGGEPISGPLPPLPTATGPFQTLTASGPAFNTGVAASHPPQAGGTIAIVAIPDRAPPLPRPTAFADNGVQVDAAVLGDADLDSGVVLDAQPDGGGHLTLDYGKAVTVRAARIFVKDAQPPFAPPRLVATLEADIGGHWTAIAPVPSPRYRPQSPSMPLPRSASASFWRATRTVRPQMPSAVSRAPWSRRCSRLSGTRRWRSATSRSLPLTG
jgi:hypothetical protein